MCAGASPTELLDRRLRKRRGGGARRNPQHTTQSTKAQIQADALKHAQKTRSNSSYSSEHKTAHSAHTANALENAQCVSVKNTLSAPVKNTVQNIKGHRAQIQQIRPVSVKERRWYAQNLKVLHMWIVE